MIVSIRHEYTRKTRHDRFKVSYELEPRHVPEVEPEATESLHEPQHEEAGQEEASAHPHK